MCSIHFFVILHLTYKIWVETETSLPFLKNHRLEYPCEFFMFQNYCTVNNHVQLISSGDIIISGTSTHKLNMVHMDRIVIVRDLEAYITSMNQTEIRKRNRVKGGWKSKTQINNMMQSIINELIWSGYENLLPPVWVVKHHRERQ